MKTSCVQCSLCQDFVWSATAAWNVQLADMELQDFASKLLAASKVFNCNSGFWLLGFCASCPSLSPSNNHIWHDVCICFAMLQHAYQGASLWERWPKGWNHQRRGCNISTPNHAVNLNLHCIAAIGSFCAAAGQFGVVFARAMVPPKWH